MLNRKRSGISKHRIFPFLIPLNISNNKLLLLSGNLEKEEEHFCKQENGENLSILTLFRMGIFGAAHG